MPVQQPPAKISTSMSRSSTTDLKLASYLDVATIESTSHLDGRLSLIGRDGLLAFLEVGDEIFLVPPKIDVARNSTVKAVLERDEGKSVIVLEEIDSIDKAEQVIGMHCLVLKEPFAERISEDACCAPYALEGVIFNDTVSGRSGKVLDAWDASGNIVAQVVLNDQEDSSKTFLIPISEDLTIDCDLVNKRMTLSLPKGIFEL